MTYRRGIRVMGVAALALAAALAAACRDKDAASTAEVEQTAVQQQAAAPAAVSPVDGPAVVARWIEALNTGDADAAMAFFIDAPIYEGGFTCGTRPCVLRDQVQGELAALVADRIRITPTRPHQHGNAATQWVEFSSDMTRAAGVERVVAAFTMGMRGDKFAAGTMAIYRADEPSAAFFRYVVAQQPPAAPPPGPSMAPNGQFVDIGGRRLYVECQGTGSPTVILEGGLGSGLSAGGKVWNGQNGRWPQVTVQPDVATVTRVCTYDRAGYGFSDQGVVPHTAVSTDDDLYAWLHSPGMQGPYVLVGISLGGPIMQFYAGRHPEDVAGLVLLDPSHENAEAAITTLLERLAPQFVETRRMNLARAATQNVAPSGPGGGFDTEAFYAQVRAMGALPAVPAAVLSAGLPLNPANFAPGVPVDEIADLDEELQHQIARRIAGSDHRFVDNSGHAMNLYAPKLTGEAIIQVVQQARRR